MKRSMTAVVCLGAGLVLGACGGKTHAPATGGLMIEIDSDLSMPQDLDRVHLEVTQLGRSLLSQDQALGAGHLMVPAQFQVTAEDHTTPVLVRGLAFKGGVARIERSAVTQIPAPQMGLLRLSFNYLCDGTATAQGTSTC